MNQRILITGGSGLLGSYLVRWFRQKGYTQITSTYSHSKDSIPADIREGVQWEQMVLPDKEAALEIIKDKDWVIHSAALVSYQRNAQYRMLDINRTGTALIVDACLAYDISHLVYIGSIGALGREKTRVTLTENSPWIENEFSTAYGLSKYLGELEVWRGAAEGLKTSIILPSVILGSGDWNRSSLQLVERIAKKSAWYPGGQTGFVDVRDIVFFISRLLEKNYSGERWILNGASLPYRELYLKIAKHLGLQKKFKLAPKWLAATILMGNNLLKGKSPGIDVINQAYGTFTYDSSKSLTLEGFQYRDLEETLREVSEAYRNGEHSLLPF